MCDEGYLTEGTFSDSDREYDEYLIYRLDTIFQPKLTAPPNCNVFELPEFTEVDIEQVYENVNEKANELFVEDNGRGEYSEKMWEHWAAFSESVVWEDEPQSTTVKADVTLTEEKKNKLVEFANLVNPDEGAALNKPKRKRTKRERDLIYKRTLAKKAEEEVEEAARVAASEKSMVAARAARAGREAARVARVARAARTAKLAEDALSNSRWRITSWFLWIKNKLFFW